MNILTLSEFMARLGTFEESAVLNMDIQPYTEPSHIDIRNTVMGKIAVINYRYCERVKTTVEVFLSECRFIALNKDENGKLPVYASVQGDEAKAIIGLNQWSNDCVEILTTEKGDKMHQLLEIAGGNKMFRALADLAFKTGRSTGETATEMGKLMEAMTESLQDGRISKSEIAKMDTISDNGQKALINSLREVLISFRNAHLSSCHHKLRADASCHKSSDCRDCNKSNDGKCAFYGKDIKPLESHEYVESILEELAIFWDTAIAFLSSFETLDQAVGKVTK